MSWRERQPSLPRPGLQFDTQSIREQEEEEEEDKVKRFSKNSMPTLVSILSSLYLASVGEELFLVLKTKIGLLVLMKYNYARININPRNTNA